jgi:peptidoglycan hydrolase-like protein with peptidoglycan-binding domain
MSVLHQGDNSPAVAQLQEALNKALGLSLKTDGDFGPVTTEAVKQFQRKFGIVADGVAGPVTLNALAGGAGYKNADVVAVVSGKRLTEQDYINAAAELGVTVAHVKTVTEVEARGTGYLSDGRVKILYERHVFYKQCPKDKRANAPQDLCQPTSGGYVGNGAEWDRLNRAIAVDESAALESASWGLFQIMGYHWKTLGYASVQDFVDANKRSEGEQLAAFVKFVKADKRLHNALRAKDWKTFARVYNGPAYAKNAYDIKLAQAFTKHSKTA